MTTIVCVTASTLRTMEDQAQHEPRADPSVNDSKPWGFRFCCLDCQGADLVSSFPVNATTEPQRFSCTSNDSSKSKLKSTRLETCFLARRQVAAPTSPPPRLPPAASHRCSVKLLIWTLSRCTVPNRSRSPLTCQRSEGVDEGGHTTASWKERLLCQPFCCVWGVIVTTVLPGHRRRLNPVDSNL